MDWKELTVVLAVIGLLGFGLTQVVSCEKNRSAMKLECMKTKTETECRFL